MNPYDLQLTLSSTKQPSGEMDLADLGALASALQQLATRVGRHVAEQPGPGRTAEAVGRATRLRLTGLARGSTVLAIGYGEPKVLEVESALEDDTAARFWDVIEGIATNTQPRWVTPLIAESAAALIDALSSAGRIAVERRDRRTISWAMSAVDRTAWTTSVTRAAPEEMVVVGRLEAVDLRSGRFRLRDDVGNAIALDQVEDPASTAGLVGSRVVATGPGSRDAAGRVGLGPGPQLSAAPLPEAWSPGHRNDWQAALARPGPSFDGIEDLTEDDVELFLAELHR